MYKKQDFSYHDHRNDDIKKYIPGIKFVLDNLYETLKDFSLFIKDLLIK